MLVGLLGTVADQKTTYRNDGACISQCSAVNKIRNQSNDLVGLLWFKFSFGAKYFKLVQFLFAFVAYSLP